MRRKFTSLPFHNGTRNRQNDTEKLFKKGAENFLEFR